MQRAMESRIIRISKKVFDIQDITKLADILQHEAKQDFNSRTRFKITYDDESSYESTSANLFSDEAIFEKIPIFIIMYYTNYVNKTIDVRINSGGRYGQRSYNNYIEISGDNTQFWVSGIHDRLTTILQSITPQDNWILRHQRIVTNVTSLAIGFLIQIIMNIFLNVFMAPLLNNILGANPTWARAAIFGVIRHHFLWLLYLIYILGIWISGLGLGRQVTQWLLELWPDVEFSFGPAHLNKKKRIRQRLTAWAVLVVLPVLLGLLVNFLSPRIFGGTQ